MGDAHHRVDSWIQWALLLSTLLGAMWSLSGRLSSLEQQTRDDGYYHDGETKRLDMLEQMITKMRATRDCGNVSR